MHLKSLIQKKVYFDMKFFRCFTILLSLMFTSLIAGVTFAKDAAQVDNFNLIEIEKPRILKKAQQYLQQAPRTVTADTSERSMGTQHDFFSEGDYWWPDPKNPDGRYIRRDGQTNPDNFIAHRISLMRLSDIIGTLTSAYMITHDDKYAAHAVVHLKAWFVDEKTRMNPNLLYGQAIKGRHTGRSIGIIDTIHLVEVALGAKYLFKSDAFTSEVQAEVKAWFRTYLTWINSHKYGLREKFQPNNHSVCWSMQAATFAYLVDDQEMLKWIRQHFKDNFIKVMMDQNGGFPQELRRTKPYGYSLFVIDAMAAVAQIASTPDDDLWTYQLPDGRGMKKGMSYIAPYIKDKKSWPLQPDVMYFDEWPVRHPSLIMAGLEFEQADYLTTWKTLDADPETYEVLRNLPLRHPLLWASKATK
tara:strand:- start:5379 stop:6623 length:1245 start_codon:yes stop_codon:yes gene_type:complete